MCACVCVWDIRQLIESQKFSFLLLIQNFSQDTHIYIQKHSFIVCLIWILWNWRRISKLTLFTFLCLLCDGSSTSANCGVFWSSFQSISATCRHACTYPYSTSSFETILFFVAILHALCNHFHFFCYISYYYVIFMLLLLWKNDKKEFSYAQFLLHRTNITIYG